MAMNGTLLGMTCVSVTCAVALAGCPGPIGPSDDAAAAPDARAADAFTPPSDDAFVAPDAFATPDAFVVPDAFVAPECAASMDCDDGDPCNGDETCDTGECADGTALGEGDACDLDASSTTRELCLAGSCVLTRCGDGFTDTVTMEECDDANDVSGDGCNDCRFSCEAASDCDDSESCNGAETCSADHVCTAGTPLANGTECAGGTGRCLSSACLPNSCDDAMDCDDGDACNGVETCEATGCASGTAPTCDDGDACTVGSCVSPTGCVQTLVDADRDGNAPTSLGACGTDCDDTNFDVGPDAPEICGNLVDDNCDGAVDEVGITTWYADCDGDGYAATGARSLMACARPAAGTSLCASGGGWTARAPTALTDTDCNDGNVDVSPAQTMFQTTMISGADMSVDFDYDCNTVEERRTTTSGSCTVAGLGCRLSEGWAADAPACGGRGGWVIGCTRGLGGCAETTEMRQQACR